MKTLLDSIEKLILILTVTFGIPFLLGLHMGGTGWGAIALGLSAVPLMEPLIAIGAILAIVIWASWPLIELFIKSQYGSE